MNELEGVREILKEWMRDVEVQGVREGLERGVVDMERVREGLEREWMTWRE